jgi:predicted O-methyltransferase YrrM
MEREHGEMSAPLILNAAPLVAVLAIAALLFRVQRSISCLVRSRLTADDLAHALAGSRHQDQARMYLSSLLKVAPERLPPLGGWAASADFLVLVAEHILNNRPSAIVEFGSGVSTLVMARCVQLNGSGKLLTFEHDEVFAKLTESRARTLDLDVNVRCVPLSPIGSFAGQWYVTNDLPEEIDLIVIDGPPMSYHPETREGAASLFRNLSIRGVVILDDAARPGERAVAGRWREAYPDMEYRYLDTEKGTLLGYCRPR